MQVHSARGPRDRPASAPGVKAFRHRRRSADRTEEEDERDDHDADTEVLALQGSAKRRVKFVEGASNFAPRGSAQAAARFARHQCQHRLQVATTLRRGDRLSPRAKHYRPSSAQVNFQRSPAGNLHVVYPPTAEVLSMVRKFDGEEEHEIEEGSADQASEAASETPTETASTGGGVQDLDIHLRNIWFMYQEQEEAADEKDKALLHALRGPDQEDREEALLNEMKLLKTGEDAIAFFAKHGDQSDLQVIHCVSHVEEGKFRPYDLVVVDEKEKGNEYFMISPKGIVHVSPGKQSEHTTLTSWMHQVMIFTVLVSMSFFRNYLTGRAFQRWRSGASNQIYAKHRQSLSRRLFLAKPIFVDAQVKVHEILRSLTFTRLLALDGHHSSMGALELRPFLVQQRELCERADLDTTAEAAREALDDAIKKVMNSAEMGYNQEDAKLMKMLQGRNKSVFAKRQLAEREAYRQKLCQFNRSLIGHFVRLVDVIQQSCLVDLAASKACSLLDRFARTSKLFLVSPTFDEAKASGDEKAIPLGLEPGKQDFQEAMQLALEQIVAVCKVPNVTSYRKYMRHFKQDPAPAMPTDVIHNNPVFRITLAGLMKQIEIDFEKAHQFGENHFAVLYKIHLHSLSWDTDTFGQEKHSHESLARGMSEMQVFDKHLQKLTTKHPVGFLSIEVTALRDSMVSHVKLSIKAMQSKLSALALETCRKAAVRYHEVNQKLQERPKVLEQLVEYVRNFKRIGGEVPELEALKTSVEDMYATLAQHNIRSVPADDFQRDLMTQRAVTFENDAMPGAQFFVNEQEDGACTEVASRYNAAEQEVEDLQDEIIGGMAADPSFLPEAQQVQKYLEEVGDKLDEFEKTFRYLNDCYVLFMQEPADTDMLEEARDTWKKRYQLWGIAVQWLDTTAKITAESLVKVDVSKIRCQLQGFVQVLGVLSIDLATDPVVLELLDTVDAWFAHRVPILAVMTGPAMSPQHWTQVVGSFSDPDTIKVSNLDFILSGAMAERGRRNLMDASAKASGEHSLVSTVSAIVEAWEHIELDLKEPEDSEAPWLLQSQDSTLDLLYEDITALQKVLQSPNCANIQAEARDMSSKLSRACDVLNDFRLLQEQYSVLEPLFRLKVLGEDEASDRVVEKFSASDEAWRLLMHRAQTTCKTVLHFTGQSTMPKQLQRIRDGLNLASESMEKLLEKQRQQSPRLWFLTDLNLMKALSDAQRFARGAAEERPGQTLEEKTLMAVDAAVGKTLADFASCFFPWIDKATSWLGAGDEHGASRKARRRSSAGQIMREELDRALHRKVEGDGNDFPLFALKAHGHVDSVKEGKDDGVATPIPKPPVQVERLLTEVKSALLGPAQAKPRSKFAGEKITHGLTSVMDDVAARMREQVDAHGAEEKQSTEIQGLSEIWPWARNLALISKDEEIHLTWPGWSCRRGALLGNWLLSAENTMQEFLRTQIKEVFKKICQSNLVDAVSNWLNEGAEAVPGQSLVLGLQLFFTNAMEISMDVEDQAGAGMVFGQVDEILDAFLQAMVRLLRLPSLTNTRRSVLCECWLQALHWQEQLDALKRAWKGGKTRDSFQWKRYLRQRWDLDSASVVINCVDWSMPYGYEYVGTAPAFVRTPETDRCFISFASALRQGHAIGLQGSPTSGKVEMVDQLARTVAVPVVKAAPPESSSLHGMLQFLASVATTNAWGLMRGVHNLEIPSTQTLSLLANMADALRSLLSATKMHKKEVKLGHYEVCCTRTTKALFFILPKSLDLPARLALELRPIAITQPAIERVVEVLLQVEGFESEVAGQFTKGLLDKAHEIVNAGIGQQKLENCSLRSLRQAVAAAGEARRRDATMADIVLSAVLALSPGEGSLHRRSLLGPKGNPVLMAQSDLLSQLAKGEVPVLKEPLTSSQSALLATNVETFCTAVGLSAGSKQKPSSHGAVSEGGWSRLALATIEVYQHLSDGRATVLLGPACCGKSVLLKAMQAASDAGRDEIKEICFWHIYPQALADDDGEGELSFQKMMPCILRTLAEQNEPTSPDMADRDATLATEHMDLIVFDGEVDGRWLDDLWPLLHGRQMVIDGIFTPLPMSAQLLFETRSLEKASPAFCSQCALCPVQDMLEIQHRLEAFRQRIEGGLAGKAARFHSSTLLAWLYRLASGIHADLKGVHDGFNEMVAADQLLHMLEAAWRAALPMDELEGKLEEVEEDELPESEMVLLEVWSIYCAAWVLGGPLNNRGRRRLGAWLLTSLEGADGLARGYAALGTMVHSDPENLWKFRIASNVAGLTGLRDAMPKTSVKLLCDVLPEPEDFDEQSLFVPAEEREAVRIFVRHQIYMDCPFGFRLWGPQNGKSALGEELIRFMTGLPGSNQSFLLRCPHRLSAGGFSDYIQGKMSRKGTLTLSSMPARKMCIVVDDVHVATFGTKEQLRQVMERRHLTGAAAQKEGGTWQVHGLWLGAIERDPGKTGERWLRHFLALQNPDLNEKSLRDVCTRLVQRWSAQVPSEEARIMLVSRSFPDTIVRIILDASNAFYESPFEISPFLDLTRWFQNISQNTKNITSTLDLQRLVWHEGMLQLGCRLESMQDRAKLRNILEEGGLTLPEDDEEPLFLDNGELQDLQNMATAQSWIRRKLGGILNTIGMPMVIFKDMVLAILSTSRALQCATPSAPAGALLLGPAGSGRRTCGMMASHLVQAELQRSNAEDVHGLLAEIQQFRKTGSDMGLQCLGPIIEDLLVLPDGECALEEIDDAVRGAIDIKVKKLTTNGSDPDAKMAKAPVRRQGMDDTPNKYEGATRLAFIICVSPATNSEWFRRQLRRFPSFGSKISPVWIQPWGDDAYFEVARTSLSWELNEGSENQVEPIYQNMASAAMQMAQVAVGEIGKHMQLPGGWALYQSVVLAAKELFKAKEEELRKENTRLTRVVAALAQMEETLRSFERKHGMAFQQVKESDKISAELAKQLEELEAKAAEASQKANILTAEAEDIAIKVRKCNTAVEDATGMVKGNLAMAALTLRGLPNGKIHECKTARQPSAALERVTFATLSALGIEESWTNVVKLLVTDFITQLEGVEIRTSGERAALVQERLEQLEALGGLVEEPGQALAQALAEWLHAFVAAVRAFQLVEDDFIALKEVQGSHHEKMKEVEAAEEVLDTFTDQILDTKQQMQSRQSERAQARGSMQYSNEELDGVASIREFLSCDEVSAWHTRHQDMARQMAELPGRFLLGSFLAHYGCFLKDKKEDVLAAWRSICEQEELLEQDEYELSEDRLLYMMAESCKVQDLELPDGSIGRFPPQLAASLFCSRKPVPLVLDPFGIVRQWLDKQLPVMTASICSEITLTSSLGSSPMQEIQAARKSKSSSLMISLGQEFSKADESVPLHPGFQSWLQSQKELPPGQLFVLSKGTRAPKSYEISGFVVDCCNLQVLEDFILAEAVEIADSHLFRLHGEAIDKRWMALSKDKALNDDMLIRVAADREHTVPLDVALSQEVLKMKKHHMEYADELKTATAALEDMQGQILVWRRFAAKAARIVHLAFEVEKWHPLYHAQGQTCLQWLWEYLAQAVSNKTPLDELTSDLPGAWLLFAASQTFPKHHPSLLCSVAFSAHSSTWLNGTFSAALRHAAVHSLVEKGKDAKEREEKELEQRDETAKKATEPEEGSEESPEEDQGEEVMVNVAAPSECTAFITDKGWQSLTNYRETFEALWKVTDSMVAEPARWTQLKENPKDSFPLEIGPVEELLTLCTFAPEVLPQRSLHLSIKELGNRGVDMLSQSKGPVASVAQAIQDARGDMPPKPILFLTEEEPGVDYTSTVRLTLESLAAQMAVPFEAVSLLDQSCSAQVGAAHARFQDQQAGWLLIEDTLDESLKTLETRHPQLLKRMDAMMDLAGQVSRRSGGSDVGPAVLVAIHYSFRPQSPSSFYSLLHLTPKVKLAARRVYVSWPVGLEANIQALDRDVKSMKDTIPREETAPNNLTDLCFLHALLQHRSRMGDGEASDSSWIMPSLKSKKHTETEEHSIEYIASLCEDVLSHSWPSNLWAMLPEQLAAHLDDSLCWNSLQGAIQEALQRHERKRRRRSSQSRSTTDKRLHSLLWRSKAVHLPECRFAAAMLQDVASVAARW